MQVYISRRPSTWVTQILLKVLCIDYFLDSNSKKSFPFQNLIHFNQKKIQIKKQEMHRCIVYIYHDDVQLFMFSMEIFWECSNNICFNKIYNFGLKYIPEKYLPVDKVL